MSIAYSHISIFYKARFIAPVIYPQTLRALISPCVYLSVYMGIYMPVFPTCFVCLSCLCLFISLPLCLGACMSACLPAYILLTLYLPVCHLCISMSVCHLSPSICLFAWISVCVYVLFVSASRYKSAPSLRLSQPPVCLNLSKYVCMSLCVVLIVAKPFCFLLRIPS